MVISAWGPLDQLQLSIPQRPHPNKTTRHDIWPYWHAIKCNKLPLIKVHLKLKCVLLIFYILIIQKRFLYFDLKMLIFNSPLLTESVVSSMFAMSHPTYQWSIQIPHKVSSRLYILFKLERHLNSEAGYFLNGTLYSIVLLFPCCTAWKRNTQHVQHVTTGGVALPLRFTKI